jgi:hypothetical protein
LAIVTILMATIFHCRRKSTLALRQRRALLVKTLAVPARLLRASLVERFGTCGRAPCRCQLGQRHGPFYYLTQCLAKGHMQKFLLKTQAQRQQAQTAIAAWQTLQEQLEELSQINAELLRRAEPLA